MIEQTGDMFTTDAFWIAHGCNVDGVMGAGVAKIVRARYPIVYEAYAKHCHGGNFKPGDCYGVYQHKTVILNLATQDRPGQNAKYEWVFKALLKAAILVHDDNHWGHKPKVIAIPEIGCGIGGLEWNKVKHLVEAVEVLVPQVEFEVWHYG